MQFMSFEYMLLFLSSIDCIRCFLRTRFLYRTNFLWALYLSHLLR